MKQGNGPKLEKGDIMSNLTDNQFNLLINFLVAKYNIKDLSAQLGLVEAVEIALNFGKEMIQNLSNDKINMIAVLTLKETEEKVDSKKFIDSIKETLTAIRDNYSNFLESVVLAKS